MKFDLSLYLIRHGQTQRNATPDLIGQSPDEPLNEFGKKQATLLHNHFTNIGVQFDEIYCSPYDRAKETCQIVLPSQQDEVKYDDRLREINQGDGVDQSRSKLYTEDFLKNLDVNGMGFKFNNGESLFEVEDRAASWLKDLLNQKRPSQGKTYKIAAFSHGQTIKSLLFHIMKFDHKMTWRIDIKNTSITKLSYVLDKWWVQYINNYNHLKRE